MIDIKLKSRLSEEYKSLRTNIQFSNYNNSINTIVITSSAQREGKSTICANLGITMAETDKKVLIIDCDLRKPTLHNKFNISNDNGLTNILSDENKFYDVARKCDDNFYILTSGAIPENPSEMLSSRKMEKFLNEVKKDFDYIILDSPPLLQVADTQALAAIVDGIVFVISARQTKVPEVEKSIELLKHVKANILGFVLNNARVSDINYRHRYYDNQNKHARKKKVSII
jgi:capsular exopolysaccharide synthesis family protein